MFSEEIARISQLTREKNLCRLTFGGNDPCTVYEYLPDTDPGFSYYMPCRVAAAGHYTVPSGFRMSAAGCHMYDVIFLFAGRLICTSSGGMMTAAENQVLLLNTDMTYTLTQAGDAPVDLLIIRNQGFIASSYYNLLMQKSLHPVTVRDPSFLSLLNRLRLYMAYPTHNNSVMIAETMTRLYSALYLEDNTVPVSDGTYGYPQWFFDIVTYIEENLQKPLSVPDLARRAGVSESRFYRLFRTYTDAAPTQYINAMRLDRSKMLLRTTDRQVKDIACEVGFPNTGYFIRLFTAAEGCSPGAYRKNFNSQSQ